MTDERQPDEQVEDLDVPEEESEDVKGGASDIFHKVNTTSLKIDQPTAGGFLGNLNVNK